MPNSPPNYTDGVPIKISERYKPPPLVHLPTKIIQHLARTRAPGAFDDVSDDYNFDLERKIISKTSEWINWRAKERDERQERLRQRELARVKRLEDEQKQKLNQVSYPSADDISSCDDDEEVTKEAPTSSQPPNIPEKPFSPTDFNTILMPTQALQNPKVHRRYASNSSNKIDFSFFESDSSPFDHLEMKSMNEMEVLAQVLGSSKIDTNNLERNSSSESEPSEHGKNNNNESEATPLEIPQPSFTHQNHQQPFSQNFAQQAYGNSGYYGGAMNQNYTTYGYQAGTATPPNFSPMNQFLYPQNYAVKYNYNHYQALTTNNNTIVNGTHENVEPVKHKAPSIFQELNDELNNSERRRIRNNSQNSHLEATQESKFFTAANDRKEALLIFFFLVLEQVASPVEDDFSQLSSKTQILAAQITQMGFQRDLVARAVLRIGGDDKKIVEHLIPLSELLQMGFEEAVVSEALIKFDNNKDAALDYLIS